MANALSFVVTISQRDDDSFSNRIWNDMERSRLRLNGVRAKERVVSGSMIRFWILRSGKCGNRIIDECNCVR